METIFTKNNIFNNNKRIRAMKPLIPFSNYEVERRRAELRAQLEDQSQMYSVFDPLFNQRGRRLIESKYGTSNAVTTTLAGYWDLLGRNSLFSYMKNPGQAFVNNLRLIGDSLDQVFLATVVKGGILSAQGDGNFSDNVKKGYGFGNEGRVDMSGSRIRENTVLDIGGIGNFAVDMGIEILTDPSTYFSLGLSGATKGISKGAGKGLSHTMAKIAKAYPKMNIEKAQVRVVSAVLSNNVDDFTVLLNEGFKLGLHQQTIRDLFKQAQKSIDPTGMYKVFKALDKADETLTKALMTLTPAGQAYQLGITKLPKLIRQVNINKVNNLDEEGKALKDLVKKTAKDAENDPVVKLIKKYENDPMGLKTEIADISMKYLKSGDKDLGKQLSDLFKAEDAIEVMTIKGYKEFRNISRQLNTFFKLATDKVNPRLIYKNAEIEGMLNRINKLMELFPDLKAKVYSGQYKDFIKEVHDWAVKQNIKPLAMDPAKYNEFITPTKVVTLDPADPSKFTNETKQLISTLRDIFSMQNTKELEASYSFLEVDKGVKKVIKPYASFAQMISKLFNVHPKIASLYQTLKSFRRYFNPEAVTIDNLQTSFEKSKLLKTEIEDFLANVNMTYSEMYNTLDDIVNKVPKKQLTMRYVQDHYPKLYEIIKTYSPNKWQQSLSENNSIILQKTNEMLGLMQYVDGVHASDVEAQMLSLAHTQNIITDLLNNKKIGEEHPMYNTWNRLIDANNSLKAYLDQVDALQKEVDELNERLRIIRTYGESVAGYREQSVIKGDIAKRKTQLNELTKDNPLEALDAQIIKYGKDVEKYENLINSTMDNATRDNFIELSREAAKLRDKAIVDRSNLKGKIDSVKGYIDSLQYELNNVNTFDKSVINSELLKKNQELASLKANGKYTKSLNKYNLNLIKADDIRAKITNRLTRKIEDTKLPYLDKVRSMKVDSIKKELAKLYETNIKLRTLINEAKDNPLNISNFFEGFNHTGVSERIRILQKMLELSHQNHSFIKDMLLLDYFRNVLDRPHYGNLQTKITKEEIAKVQKLIDEAENVFENMNSAIKNYQSFKPDAKNVSLKVAVDQKVYNTLDGIMDRIMPFRYLQTEAALDYANLIVNKQGLDTYKVITNSIRNRIVKITNEPDTRKLTSKMIQAYTRFWQSLKFTDVLINNPEDIMRYILEPEKLTAQLEILASLTLTSPILNNVFGKTYEFFKNLLDIIRVEAENVRTFNPKTLRLEPDISLFKKYADEFNTAINSINDELNKLFLENRVVGETIEDVVGEGTRDNRFMNFLKRVFTNNLASLDEVDNAYGIVRVMGDDFDLHNPDQVFVVFDLETNGDNPFEDQILQISAKKVKRDGTIVEQYNKYVLLDQNQVIPKKLIDIHGINSAKLESERLIGNALPMDEAINEFVNWAYKDGVKLPLVGHNVQFDYDFLITKLKQYYEKQGVEMPNDIIGTVIDTYQFALRVIDKDKTLPDYKLKSLAKKFDMDIIDDELHNADYDTFLDAQVFIKMLDEHAQDFKMASELNNYQRLNAMEQEVHTRSIIYEDSIQKAINAKNKYIERINNQLNSKEMYQNLLDFKNGLMNMKDVLAPDEYGKFIKQTDELIVELEHIEYQLQEYMKTIKAAEHLPYNEFLQVVKRESKQLRIFLRHKDYSRSFTNLRRDVSIKLKKLRDGFTTVSYVRPELSPSDFDNMFRNRDNKVYTELMTKQKNSAILNKIFSNYEIDRLPSRPVGGNKKLSSSIPYAYNQRVHQFEVLFGVKLKRMEFYEGIPEMPIYNKTLIDNNKIIAQVKQKLDNEIEVLKKLEQQETMNKYRKWQKANVHEVVIDHKPEVDASYQDLHNTLKKQADKTNDPVIIHTFQMIDRYLNANGTFDYEGFYLSNVRKSIKDNMSRTHNKELQSAYNHFLKTSKQINTYFELKQYHDMIEQALPDTIHSIGEVTMLPMYFEKYYNNIHQLQDLAAQGIKSEVPLTDFMDVFNKFAVIVNNTMDRFAIESSIEYELYDLLLDSPKGYDVFKWQNHLTTMLEVIESIRKQDFNTHIVINSYPNLLGRLGQLNETIGNDLKGLEVLDAIEEMANTLLDTLDGITNGIQEKNLNAMLLMRGKKAYGYKRINRNAGQYQILDYLTNSDKLSKLRTMLNPGSEPLDFFNNDELQLAELFKREANHPAIVRARTLINDVYDNLDFMWELTDLLDISGDTGYISELFDLLNDIDYSLKNGKFNNADEMVNAMLKNAMTRLDTFMDMEKLKLAREAHGLDYNKTWDSLPNVISAIEGYIRRKYRPNFRFMFNPTDTTNDLVDQFRELTNAAKVVFPDLVKGQGTAKVTRYMDERFTKLQAMLNDVIKDIRHPFMQIAETNRKFNLHPVLLNTARDQSGKYEIDHLRENSYYTIVYSKEFKENKKLGRKITQTYNDLFDNSNNQYKTVYDPKSKSYVKRKQVAMAQWTEDTKTYAIFEFLANELGIDVETFTGFVGNAKFNKIDKVNNVDVFNQKFDKTIGNKLREFFFDENGNKKIESIADTEELMNRLKAGYMSAIQTLKLKGFDYQVPNKIYNLYTDFTNNMTYGFNQLRGLFSTDEEFLAYLKKTKDTNLVIIERAGGSTKLREIKINSIDDLKGVAQNENIAVGFVTTDTLKMLRSKYARPYLSERMSRLHKWLVTYPKIGMLFNAGFLVGNMVEVLVKHALVGQGNIVTMYQDLASAHKAYDMWYRAYLEASKDETLFNLYKSASRYKWIDHFIENTGKGKFTNEEIELIRFVDNFFTSSAGASEMQEFTTNIQILNEKDAIGKVKKNASRLDKVEATIDKYLYSGLIAKNFGMNARVEGVGRLALYMNQLNSGFTSDEALLKVLKTYFNYGDKSKAELYAEFIIPFLSYPLRNYEFFMEIMNSGAKGRMLADAILLAWEDQELEGNDYLLYRMSRGDLPVSDNLLFQSGIGMNDAMTLVPDIANVVSRKQNPLLRLGKSGIDAVLQGNAKLISDQARRMPYVTTGVYPINVVKSFNTGTQLDTIFPSVFNNYYQRQNYNYRTHGFSQPINLYNQMNAPRLNFYNNTNNLYRSLYTRKGVFRPSFYTPNPTYR